MNVLETNTKAIQLYEQFGFEMEGVLRKDKRLSDGRYYNTVVMGRC
ncbi:Acetyltransferase [Cohnella lubricantis]